MCAGCVADIVYVDCVVGVDADVCYATAAGDCVGGDVGADCVDCVGVGCVVDRVYVGGGDAGGVCVAGVAGCVGGDVYVDVGGVDVDMCGCGDAVGCVCVC